MLTYVLPLSQMEYCSNALSWIVDTLAQGSTFKPPRPPPTSRGNHDNMHAPWQKWEKCCSRVVKSQVALGASCFFSSSRSPHSASQIRSCRPPTPPDPAAATPSPARVGRSAFLLWMLHTRPCFLLVSCSLFIPGLCYRMSLLCSELKTRGEPSLLVSHDEMQTLIQVCIWSYVNSKVKCVYL